DAVYHLLPAHDFLVWAVAAALLHHLVLDVHGAGAELDQRLHGARDVESAAEAGVYVDKQWTHADIGDAADVGQHVVQRADGEVRQPERAGGDSTARQIDCAIARALREPGVVGVDGADDLQRPLSGDGGAKAGPGRAGTGGYGGAFGHRSM